MEIHRAEPSYTVDTLREVRRERPGEPVFWMIGLDAFRDIGTWHRPQELFDLAHLLLLERPGSSLDGPTRALYEKRRLDAAPATSCGGILKIKAPMLDISASRIRGRVAAGRPVAHLLPDGVGAYIRRHRLYAGDRATEHPGSGFSDRRTSDA